MRLARHHRRPDQRGHDAAHNDALQKAPSNKGGAITCIVVASFALLVMAAGSHAANSPCSGKKGGVSHCAAGKFVCNDGSISGSKKVCSMPGAAAQGLMAVPKSSESACSCRAGTFCTGPRGGTYCYSDSGQKSYVRK